jgi:hypothetical protein
MFFAMWRARYDALLSTFEGSLPENAPPPWLPCPPVVLGVGPQEVRADDLLYDLLHHALLDLLHRGVHGVLCRYDDGVDERGPAVYVAHRYLALAVGPQEIEDPGFARLCEPHGDPVRKRYRERH